MHSSTNVYRKQISLSQQNTSSIKRTHKKSLFIIHRGDRHTWFHSQTHTGTYTDTYACMYNHAHTHSHTVTDKSSITRMYWLNTIACFNDRIWISMNNNNNNNNSMSNSPSLLIYFQRITQFVDSRRVVYLFWCGRARGKHLFVSYRCFIQLFAVECGPANHNRASWQPDNNHHGLIITCMATD